MKRPSVGVMLVGHPLVAAPAVLAGGVLLYAAWRAGSSALVPGVLAFAAICAVGTANTRATRYRTWQRAWNGVGGDPSPRLSDHRAVRAAAAVLVVLTLGLYLATRTDINARLALGWLVMGSALVVIVLAVRALRRTRRPRRTSPLGPVVAICAKPLLPSPSLERAYAALPDHCLRVLLPPETR